VHPGSIGCSEWTRGWTQKTTSRSWAHLISTNSKFFLVILTGLQCTKIQVSGARILTISKKMISRYALSFLECYTYSNKQDIMNAGKKLCSSFFMSNESISVQAILFLKNGKSAQMNYQSSWTVKFKSELVCTVQFGFDKQHKHLALTLWWNNTFIFCRFYVSWWQLSTHQVTPRL